MKLKRYLTEESIDWETQIKLIKKNCQPILNLYKKTKWPIYRGILHENREFVKKSVRSDRNPRVIGKGLHELLDKLFLKYWGFKARSQGLFCGSFDTAFSWSRTGDEPHIVFPIGNFSYIYTINPAQGFWDILIEYKNLDLSKMVEPESIIEEIEYAVKNDYNNKGLESKLKKENDLEIIINCKEYYGLQDNDFKMLPKVLEDIKGV